MEATPDPTAQLVVAVCLVVAVGGVAGVAVVDDAVGVASAQSSNLTADEIRNFSYDPEPANPGDTVAITGNIFNKSNNEPVGGVEVTFVSSNTDGTLTIINKTSNSSGFVKSIYEPDTADIKDTPTILIQISGDTTGNRLSVEPSADGFRNETVDPDSIDPGNQTAISAQVINELNQSYGGANVTFDTNDGAGNLTVTQSTSDVDGWVNATYEAADADAGKIVTVDITANETDANTTIPITVTANTAGFDNVTVKPRDPAADENVSLTARVLDEANNPLNETTVDFGTTGSGAFVRENATSNETGYVSTTYIPDRADNDTTVDLRLAPGTDAETNRTVTFAALSIVDFTNESVAPETIDPGKNATVTAVARDEFNESLPNRTVDIDAIGAGALNDTQVETASEGRIAVRYEAAAGDAGSDIRITIVANETDAETNVTLPVGANADTIRNVSVEPPIQDRGEDVNVSAEVYDEAGQLLNNASVTFTASAEGGVDAGDFTDANATSGENGVVNATFTPNGSAANRTVTITVGADGTDVSNTTTLNVTANADRIDAAVAPEEIDPGTETNVSARVFDESGSPLPEANVSVGANGSGMLNESTLTSTDEGWVNTSYIAAGDDAGTDVQINVTADDTDAAANTTVTVTANPASFTTKTVVPEIPEPNESTDISVRVRDESGSPLNNASIELTVTNGNNSLEGVPATSNERGWINASYTPNGSDAGTEVAIEVTANATSANETITFTVSELAATEFHRTAADPDPIDPINTTNRDNETTVGVQVLDQVGDELGGAEIAFTVTDGEGDLNTGSINSSTDGWANVTYTANRTDANETVTIEANTTERRVDATITLNVTANADRFTNTTVDPADPEPNEPTDVAIQVRDESGSPLEGAGVELTVTDGDSSLVGVPATSNASGWINTTYTPNGSDANGTVAIEVTANETDISETITFTVSDLAATEFDQAVADPDPIDPVNTTYRDNETTVGVHVLDQVGNELGGTEIAFTVTNAEGSLNTSSTNSSTDGWANVTYTANQTDADRTISIRANATDRSVNRTILVDVTANADEIIDPTAVPGDEPNETVAINATVLDESGAVLEDSKVQITAPNGSGTIQDGTVTSDTDGHVETTYDPNRSDANTTVELKFNATNTIATNTTTVDIPPLAATTITDTSLTAEAVAPGNTTRINATVRDQFGEPLNDSTVTFASSRNGTFDPDVNTSVDGGLINTTYMAADTDANTTDTIYINASDDNRDAFTTVEVFVTANATTITDAAATNSMPEPNESTTITATVRDESNDPLPGANVTFETNDSAGFEAVSKATNDTGEVSAAYTPTSDDANGTVDVGVVAEANRSVLANVTLDVGPLAASGFENGTVDPEEIDPVDIGDRANETTISVQVLDQFGEPLTDSKVTFEDTGAGTITTDQDTSNATGWVNTTYNAARDDANTTVNVTVNATGRAVETALSVTVTANPDRFEQVGATPDPVDPGNTTTIAAQVTDESNDTIEGANVTVSVEDGNGTFSGGEKTTNVTSNETGFVTADYEPNRTDANRTVTIGLNATATNTTASETIEIGPLLPETIEPEPADPKRIDPVDEGDRANETTLTAQVRDQFNEPLAGANVIFGHDGNGTLTVERSTSNDQGWVNTSYAAARGDAGENITVDIEANTTNSTGDNATAAITINVTANPDRFETVTAQPPADPSAPIAVNATVLDESNATLEGTTVTFDLIDGNGTLGNDSDRSDDTGFVETIYEPNRTDANRTIDIELNATATGLTRTVTINVSPLSPDGFANESATPEAIDPRNETTLSARVLDEFNETFVGNQTGGDVTGADMTFDHDGNGTLSSKTNTSNETGWVTTSYVANDEDAGTEVVVSVTANATGVETALPFDVTANPTTFANRTVDPEPPEPNESTTVALQVRDESDDPLGDVGVEFNVTSGEGTLNRTGFNGTDAGWVNASYTPSGSDANGTVDIEVTANATSANRTVTFTVSKLAAAEFNRTVADPPVVDPINTTNRDNRTTVGVQILNQVGDPLNDSEINFTVTSGGGELNTSSINSSDDGWANVTYTANRSDANRVVEIEANATGRNVNRTIEVNVTANADRITYLNAVPGNEPNEAVTINATVFDESEDELDGANINITANRSGTIDEQIVRSEADGLVEITYDPNRSDANETVKLTFNATNTTVTNTTTVDIPPLAATTINGTNLTVTEVDPGNTARINATVRDQFGQPLDGSTVNFTSQRNGSFSAIQNTSVDSGLVNATYTAADADANRTDIIYINATDREAFATVEVRVTANPANFTEPIVTPEIPEPNESTNIALQVRDESDDPLGNASVELTKESANGTLDDTGLTSTDDGWLNTSFTPNGSDADTEVRIDVTATETDANTTITFTVSKRAAESFTEVSADPTEIDPVDADNRTNTTNISARVLDQVNDPLEGANVSFSTDSENGTLIDIENESNADGWVNATFLAAREDANTTVTVTINATNRSAETTQNVTVTASADRITDLNAVPGGEPNETVAINARVLDESGSDLDGAEVNITAPNGSGTIQEEIVTSDTDGIVETTYEPNRSDANETVKLTFNATNTTATNTTTVAIPPLAATTITDTTLTGTDVDPGNTTQVAATVRDQFDQSLNGSTVSVTSRRNGTFSEIRNTSADGGLVNATYTANDSDANTTDTIYINATDRNASISIQVNVTANPANFIKPVISPEAPEPNESTDIALQVLDESDDPLGDAGVELTKESANGTLDDTGLTSTDDGWLNTSYTPNGSDADSEVRINMTANETDASTTIAFTVSKRAVDSFTDVSTAPTGIDPVNTSNRTNTTNISARVLDQVDESLEGGDVRFELASGNGTLTADRNTSNADGWVNATYAANRTDANRTVNVTINATGRAAETTLSIDVTANADAIVNATTTPEAVDPGSTATISATVHDESKSDLEGANVTFSTDGNASVEPLVNTSLANGTVRAEYTPDQGDANETIEITIESNRTSATTTTSLSVNRLRADTIRNASADPQTVDPGNTTTISATVYDSLNRTINGENVTITATGNGTTEAIANTSRDNGTVEATYMANRTDAGANVTVAINATETGANTSIEIAVDELAVESFGNRAAIPNEIDPVANDERDNTTELSARVFDQVGEPLDGATVAYNVTQGYGTVDDENVTSDDGWVNTTYRAARDDANTTVVISLNATGSGVGTNLTINVTANPDKIANVDVPTTADPGDEVTVSLTVVDESNDPFEGETVTFGTTSSTDSSFSGNDMSGPNGVASSILTIDAGDIEGGAGLLIIPESDNLGSMFPSIEVTENADDITNATVTPTPVDPNETATISATVLNENGQELEGATISFEPHGAGSLTPSTDKSNGDGVVETVYEPGRADAGSNVTVTINATDTAAERNATVQVDDLRPVAITNGTSTPPRVEPGEQATINATVRDQFGEPLPAANVTFDTAANGTVTPVTATSQPNGTVAATFTPTAEANATIEITATETGASTNVSLEVLDLTPTSFAAEMATPTEIAAGNRTNLSARVLDQLGTRVADANVSVTTDGNGTLGSDTVTSNGDGWVNTTYEANVSDISRTVTVDFESVNGSANTSVGFDVHPTPQGFENVTVEPASVDPGAPVSITATVVDERDLPLGGTDVRFEANRSASVDPVVNTSNATGAIGTRYTPLAGGNASFTLTAQDTGVSTGVDVGVAALAPTAITNVTVDPNPIYPGQNATVSATIRDQLGDPFGGTTVAFNGSGNGTLSAATSSSDPSGTVQTVYQSAAGDANETITLDLNETSRSLTASATITVRPERQTRRSRSGSDDSDDAEIIVDERAGSEVDDTELTDIQGSESSIRIENPPRGEAVSLDSSTTGLSTLSATANTSLEGVSVSVTDRQSYWLNATSYDYDGLRIQDSQPADPQQARTLPEPAQTGDSRADDGQQSDSVETFVDFERNTQRIPIGYLQVDTSAAPKSVERVAFEFRVDKAHLADKAVDPEDIKLYRKDDEGWGALETRYIRENESYHWFESESPGLSVFPIGTDQRPVVITDTALSTSQISPGEQATVTVDFDNRGLLENRTQVTLSANGEAVETESVTIRPKSDTTAELTFAPDAEGEYDLAVEGRAVGTLTVDDVAAVGVIEPIGDALDSDNQRWLVVGFVVLVVLAAWRRR